RPGRKTSAKVLAAAGRRVPSRAESVGLANLETSVYNPLPTEPRAPPPSPRPLMEEAACPRRHPAKGGVQANVPITPGLADWLCAATPGGARTRRPDRDRRPAHAGGPPAAAHPRGNGS